MIFNNSNSLLFDRVSIDCLLSDNKFVKIYNFFIVNNYKLTENIDITSIVILDLCGVNSELVDATHRKIEYYLNLGKKIILLGCISKIFIEKYGDRLIYIDSKSYTDIEKYFEFSIGISKIGEYFHNGKIDILDTDNSFKKYESELSNFDKIAFIEISDGCQLNCSYCNIKKIKGNTVSQTKENIINQIIQEVNNKKTKIFLLSDDCGSYGSDIGTNIVELLKDIFSINSEIKVYITNIYPSYLVKYYEDIKKFIYGGRIPYILVPVQHYSPRILKLMNRSYDVEKITEVLKDIKKNSKTELHNHIIFNYNEETLDEFMQALKFLNYYDKTFFFKYSDVNNIYGNNHVSYDLDKKFILLKKLQKKYNIDISI
ncbi:MAG: radical SAM protein [Candidatus Gracilibacteria bacterium]|nr:radical SAM protein [Candidatus Gracilibacteria bacterium]